MNDPTNTVFKTTYGYGTGGGINIDRIVSGTDVVTVRYVSKVEAGIGGYTLPGGAIQYDDPQARRTRWLSVLKQVGLSLTLITLLPYMTVSRHLFSV